MSKRGIDIVEIKKAVKCGELVIHEEGGLITVFHPTSGEVVDLGQAVPKKIDRFDGQWKFLSNFYEGVPITYRGITYGSSEAAFQAQKCPSRAGEFVNLTPGQAKRLGRQVKIVSQWDSIKLAVMDEILRVKFSNEYLADLLNKTGNAKLIEGNTWNDRFWGVDGTGQNWLGYLLERVREIQRFPKHPYSVACVQTKMELLNSHSAYLDYKIDVLGDPDEGLR